MHIKYIKPSFLRSYLKASVLLPFLLLSVVFAVYFSGSSVLADSHDSFEWTWQDDGTIFLERDPGFNETFTYSDNTTSASQSEPEFSSTACGYALRNFSNDFSQAELFNKGESERETRGAVNCENGPEGDLVGSVSIGDSEVMEDEGLRAEYNDVLDEPESDVSPPPDDPISTAPDDFTWSNPSTISSSDENYIRYNDEDFYLREGDDPDDECASYLNNFNQELDRATLNHPSGSPSGCFTNEALVIISGAEDNLSEEERSVLSAELTSDGDIDGVQCQASGLSGFLLCDVLLNILDWIESIQTFIAETLFEFDPLTVDDPTDDPIYTAWTNFRNIANALLIVAFMAVIFSLALSVNVDAYTIKRIVPRLLTAAVAIQASYFISAIMVDATNVLGQGLQGMTDVALDQVNIDGDSWGAGLGSGAASGLVLGAGFFAVAGAVFALFYFFLPVILIVFLLLLGAFAIVAFREIFIILFIVTSPVFFLANLLPATERWFKFWWSNFSRLLLMYPFIVLMIQMGNMAALITLATVGAPPDEGVLNQATDEGIATASGDALQRMVAPLMALLMQALGIISIYFAFKVGGSALSFATSGARSLRKFGGGGGSKGGSGKGPLGRLRKDMSDKRAEFASGAKGGSGASGRVIRNAVAPGQALGPKSEGRSMATYMQGVGEAGKSLEAEGVGNPKVLNEFAQHGGSAKDLGSRVKQLRSEGKGDMADQLQALKHHAGKSQFQAAAFQASAEKAPDGDTFRAISEQFGDNPKLRDQLIGDAAFKAGKAGRPDLQAEHGPQDVNDVINTQSPQDLAKVNAAALRKEAKDAQGNNILDAQGNKTYKNTDFANRLAEQARKPENESLRRSLSNSFQPNANMNPATQEAYRKALGDDDFNSLQNPSSGDDSTGSTPSGGGQSGGGSGGSGAQGGGSSGSTPPPPPPPPPSPGGGSGGSQGPGSGPGGIIQPGDSDFNIPPGSRPPGN